jgi:hypothetical protein
MTAGRACRAADLGTLHQVEALPVTLRLRKGVQTDDNTGGWPIVPGDGVPPPRRA